MNSIAKERAEGEEEPHDKERGEMGAAEGW